MSAAPRVGVLALQGDFAPHVERLRALGANAIEVRAPESLERLTHLVLPGGESTTLYRLMQRFGFLVPLRDAHREGRLALFGTCAGAILLGRSFESCATPPRLGLIDVELERNGYGRQVHSRRRAIVPCVPSLAGHDSGLFIRAPRIRRCGEGVRILARDECGDPVLVGDERVLLATYHPELDEEPALHRLFLELRAGETVRAGGSAGSSSASS